MNNLKAGDLIENGYCRMIVVRESEYKQYSYLVQITYSEGRSYGANKMIGHRFHMSYKALLDCKIVE